jgi:hypothetical protein
MLSVSVRRENAMTVTTGPLASQLAKRNDRRLQRAALAAVFWIVAALAVSLAHSKVAAPVEAAIVEVSAILVIAAAYIRIAARAATLDHALFIGTSWVLLAIITEVVMTAHSGRQWFALLGTPANGGLRCVLLIAWVIAPALFVRSAE